MSENVFWFALGALALYLFGPTLCDRSPRRIPVEGAGGALSQPAAGNTAGAFVGATPTRETWGKDLP